MTSVVALALAAVRKPSFMEPLHNITTKEGERVCLEARFTGEPPPQIQWVRNDAAILPSAVFKVSLKSACYQYVLERCVQE